MRQGRWQDQRGFNLVELMVTITITLIVLGGSFRAFNDARLATEAASMSADGNQNLRVAVTQITRDALQTGRELPNAGMPIPRGTGAVDLVRPGPPGTNLTIPTAWTVLPSICPGSSLGPTVNGVQTDLVTVLYTDALLDLNAWPLASIASDGSRMTVDTQTAINDTLTGLRPGDLILFTNAVGNAIQTVTSVSGQVVNFAATDVADPFMFNQRGAAQGTIMQIRTGVTFPPTSASRVTMVSYYLDTTTAAGQFRLMRRVGFGTARLIATGIENLQATYDIVDGTTNPTNQSDAVAPNTPSQIRKLNLYLGVRSDSVSTVTRQIARSGVATQVSLRSMSFMDRYR